jgi:hypothetical protein
MESEFKSYSKILDLEVERLPTLEECLEIQKNVWEKERTSVYIVDLMAGSAFMKNLKKILEILKARDIGDYDWQEYISCITFKPVGSPYFRLGLFGRANNVRVDENLEGIIGIGFGEDLDYPPNHKPELVIFYKNDNFYTDINLYKPEEWRKAINEFFDITKFTK